MKPHFKISFILLSSLFLSFNSFSQSPGNIDVVNNTDCNISVTVNCYNGATCTSTFCAYNNLTSSTAIANSTTTINAPTGFNGHWGLIIMETGINSENSGPCFISSTDGCDCNGADIKISMDNCSLATIELE